MTALAQQVVLHPTVTSSLKVLSTTVGRDKTYRAVQYASRFLAWHLASRGYSKELVSQFSALKSALGQSRKLMRVGKWVEHLQSAVKATSVSDPFLRVTTIGRQLGYAIYLVNDTLIWLHGTKVKQFSLPTYARIQKEAARFWLIGITFSLISGIYQRRQISYKLSQTRSSSASPEKEVDTRAEIKTLKAQYEAVNYQFVQDSLDWFLPATSLGFTNLNEGTLGLIGLVTSVMGLNSQIKKVLGPSVKSA